MNKITKFLLLSILLLTGRFYDVYTTRLYTPSLEQELNPVVQYLGAGWTVMIVIQILLSLLIIGCLYFYMFMFHPHFPLQPGLNRKQIISYMLYRDTASFKMILYKLPQNKHTVIAATGYVGTYVLIIISYIVGTSTVLLLCCNSYRKIYAQGIPFLFYGVIIVLTAFFYYRFFGRYFQKYKIQCKTETRFPG